jgi:hypothetical protein
MKHQLIYYSQPQVKKVYQLLAHGWWFSPGTLASFTTKTGRHDIAEILLKVVLKINQRLPGACYRSPGSKLLSITTQLHCGGHLGGRARLPNTILEEDHPMTIPSKFGSN